ncbi:hypothetical protein TNCV_3469951 [Trichonephila clavipes]|nr:hypothetical protein TNCV_3469951 [Trichonephila clavipes]
MADSPLCPLCKSVPMAGEHLFDCPALLHVLSQNNCLVLLPARATSDLYWTVRRLISESTLAGVYLSYHPLSVVAGVYNFAFLVKRATCDCSEMNITPRKRSNIIALCEQPSMTVRDIVMVVDERRVRSPALPGTDEERQESERGYPRATMAKEDRHLSIIARRKRGDTASQLSRYLYEATEPVYQG